MRRRTKALEELEVMLLAQVRAMVREFEKTDTPPTLDVFKALTTVHSTVLNALKMYPEDKLPETFEEALFELETLKEDLQKKRDEAARKAH